MQFLFNSFQFQICVLANGQWLLNRSYLLGFYSEILMCNWSYGLLITQKQPPEVFCKKFVLENLAYFTGIYLCRNLIKTTPTQEFSCEICENCKNNYFEEHLRMTLADHCTLSLASCGRKFHDKTICEVYNDLPLCFNILFENSL